MSTHSLEPKPADAEPGDVAASPADAPPAHRWGLISRHGAALGVIARDPSITVREVAQAIGVTERSATSILRDLRDAGFVDVRRVGRRNYYLVNREQRLRSDGFQESTVGELLAALHTMTEDAGADASPGAHAASTTAGAQQDASSAS